MHSPRVSIGDAKKRVAMKTSNPRKDKRGGRKSIQRGKTKILEKTVDFILTLHLKLHHLRDSKNPCESNKCPFRNRVFNNPGQIPFIPLQK